MSVESDADRAAYLADFGQPVIFTPGAHYPNRSDKTKTIQAIFDNAFFSVEGDDQGANTRRPAVMCASIDTLEAARNSMVEIAGAVYKVTSPEPDGTGMTELILEGPK